MIRKTYSFVLTCLLLAGLASCNKDDKKEEPSKTNKLVEYNNGESKIRFQLDAQKNISKIFVVLDVAGGDAEKEYDVAYNNDHRIASLTNADHEKVEAIYQDGHLKRSDLYYDNDLLGHTEYEFQNNDLHRMTLNFDLSGLFEPTQYRFEWAAGNLKTVEVFDGDGHGGWILNEEVALEYDQKSNPLSDQNDILMMLWTVASKNNIVIENHFNPAKQLTNKLTYTYLYNNNGLPVSGVAKVGLPGQPQEARDVIFKYQ